MHQLVSAFLESPSSAEAQSLHLCYRSFNQNSVRVAKFPSNVISSWRVHWLDLVLKRGSPHEGLGFDVISHRFQTIAEAASERLLQVLITQSTVTVHPCHHWLLRFALTKPQAQMLRETMCFRGWTTALVSHSQRGLPVCPHFQRQTEKEKTIDVDCL